jgi:hypothetical protein
MRLRKDAMSVGRPRSASVSCAIALAFLLVLGTLLTPPSFARPSVPTGRAADPGYTVVPWANESVRVLDSRVAWLPPLIGYTGPGLLLANDPYAATPAAVAAMSSPAPNGGVALYDYATRSTQNLTFPWSFAGASGSGDVTPFTREGKTYILTLSHYGIGVSGGITYQGKDVQIVAAGILDYPAFAHFVAVNLSVPLVPLGYTMNTLVGVQFEVTPDGTNLSAVVEVERATGTGRDTQENPPWAKYVYFVDLTQANWTDGQPLVLAPRWTVPWWAPVTSGYTILLTPSLLMMQGYFDSSSNNLWFYDLDRGTWTNATIPGEWPTWHGRIGGNLYLLEINSMNASYEDYILDRVDLDALGAPKGTAEVWDKLFPRYTNNYSAYPVINGDRLDVFLGENGWQGGPSPTLTTVYSYDLVCGSLLSTTNVSLTVPLLNGQLMSLAYPSQHDDGFAEGFVAEFTHGILYPLDLPAVRNATAAYRHETPCASCVYAVYVTRDAFPHLDLLIEEQYAPSVFTSNSTTNLTAVELTANASPPPPLPTPPGGCRLTPATPLPPWASPPSAPVGEGGPGVLLEVALAVAFALAVAVAILAFVLLRRRRRVRSPPASVAPPAAPAGSAQSQAPDAAGPPRPPDPPPT